jgi:hypothetical protein
MSGYPYGGYNEYRRVKNPILIAPIFGYNPHSQDDATRVEIMRFPGRERGREYRHLEENGS